MTTPVTLAGRIVSLIWMFAAIILISGFTAAIATSLTVSRLESNVGGPGDLPGVAVATVSNSSSAAYLQSRGIGYVGVDTIEQALERVATGAADAVVYDAPILRYVTSRSFGDSTRVLGGTFKRQDYAIALPAGSELREPVNRRILEIIGGSEWQSTLTEYLGGE
ncbi:MAG: transporter substrate-binding domain-containing protein [Gammaproteobacteria bacterium]|nr:transporter substrate-binding domain-containing protein [Gammaproteobacteria bacterium]